MSHKAAKRARKRARESLDPGKVTNRHNLDPQRMRDNERGRFTAVRDKGKGQEKVRVSLVPRRLDPHSVKALYKKAKRGENG